MLLPLVSLAALLIAIAALIPFLEGTIRAKIGDYDEVRFEAATREGALTFADGCGATRMIWDSANRVVLLPPSNSLTARQCVQDRKGGHFSTGYSRFIYRHFLSR